MVTTAPSVLAVASEHHVAPLVLLDTHDRVQDLCRCPSKSKFSNPAIVQIASTVVSLLLQLHPTWRVAVCCFYSLQVENLQGTLVTSERLTVDTVDGLQGSEFDVLVLACAVAGAVSIHGHWQDAERVNVLRPRARQQVVIIAPSAVLVTSGLWRRVLVAAPWVRFDVAADTSAEELSAAVSCPRRPGDRRFYACIRCCKGTDVVKPETNFSRKSLKAHEAAEKQGRAMNLQCIVCTMVSDKDMGLVSRTSPR